MTLRRVGILGGTFDPIHTGHLDAGRAAAAALGLTRTIVIPSHIPPHRPQPTASSFHRFAMAAMAVSGTDGWRASDMELRSGAQSFTTSTLQRFHERGYAPAELFFVIGADAFLEISTWRNYPALLDDAHFAVVSRPGLPVGTLAERLPALAGRMTRPAIGVPGDAPGRFATVIWLIDAETADVSSTAIRQRIAQGESIAGLVPAGVRQHIEQHGLYTSSIPDRRSR